MSPPAEGPKLYEYSCYCGRAGTVAGRFVLDVEDQARLEELYGEEICYGEILGKHSDVHLTLKREDVRLVTDDQDFLERARQLGIDLTYGVNPLEHWVDMEHEDEDA